MQNVEHLNIRSDDGGTLLPIKAVPGASRDKIIGVLGDALKIATSAAPEKGKANAALARTLAKALGVNRRTVTVVAGATNPRKEFRLEGISPDQLRELLRKL